MRESFELLSGSGLDFLDPGVTISECALERLRDMQQVRVADEPPKGCETLHHLGPINVQQHGASGVVKNPEG
jgi:hypothetical protein